MTSGSVGHRAVGCLDRCDRLGAQALEHPREDAVVQGLGEVLHEAVGGGHELVQGRHDRRVRDQLARQSNWEGAPRLAQSYASSAHGREVIESFESRRPNRPVSSNAYGRK